MKMLQNVSHVVSVQVQILANNVNGNTFYSKHNAIFNLCGIFSINKTKLKADDIQ